MESVMEQFIPSDKSKGFSKLLKNISIAIAVLGVINLVLSLVFTIIFEIVAAALFIFSYLYYVDYEYEVVNETITISKIYNCSRRKVVATFDRDQVKRVFLTNKNDIRKRDSLICYNSKLEDLTVYTFELQNNKKFKLALNEELEKMVKIYYRQVLTNY